MYEYAFLSSDSKHMIHCAAWKPEQSPKAIVLIVHGMCEYIERYTEFAEHLSSYGFLAAGHDLLGHGRSVKSNTELGFFGKNGNEYLLSDIDMHIRMLKEECPDTPLILFGHSMGSFLVRQYICLNSEKLNGAIICGTGVQTRFNLLFGRKYSESLAKIFGWHFRSKTIQLIAFGRYLKRVKNPETPHDWLTHDRTIIEKFKGSEKSNYIFTLNGFHEMIYSIAQSQDENLIEKIRKDLPLFFIAGDEDPVGDYGKGVKTAVKLYKKANMTNIKSKLYENDRHEILNELDRKQIFRDIRVWIEKCALK